MQAETVKRFFQPYEPLVRFIFIKRAETLNIGQKEPLPEQGIIPFVDLSV